MDITKHVKTKFLAGLFILIPVIITIYVIYVVVSSVDAMIYPVIQQVTWTITGMKFYIPGTGLLLFVLITYATGIFAANFVGNKILCLGEALLTRIPFVKSICNAVKDMTDTFSSQTKKAFKEVVLVDFPSKDTRAMGFITRRTSIDGLGTICSVFIPTTPNPTSGFLVMVPEQKLTFLRMTVDEALKYIISLGTSRIELR
ncbi:MAG: DUF502 domain-containing protein [Syntrophobacterales bacterium]|jgi:uncharacterized membrane protein|nr:DUF502 domain-containing protein [Syntrophobacterales bacterium]